jgi:hypothetical protein
VQHSSDGGPTFATELREECLELAFVGHVCRRQVNAGPQFFELALKVVNGEPVPKRVPSTESVFFPDNAKDILPTRKY